MLGESMLYFIKRFISLWLVLGHELQFSIFSSVERKAEYGLTIYLGLYRCPPQPKKRFRKVNLHNSKLKTYYNDDDDAVYFLTLNKIV